MDSQADVMITPGEDIARPPAPTGPFSCGLPRDMTLRLLSGRFSKADYAAYRRTSHWRAKKAEAFEVHGRLCALCDAPATEVHHRPGGYRALFREDPVKHLLPLCARCHVRHHRR